MKIVFVTSCIEPGRDGIGDYCLQLAAECVRQGHTAAIFAYRDRHVSAATHAEGAIPSLRLPAGIEPEEVVAQAGRFIRQHAPDAISFQFAPYTFHPRGFLDRWVHLWPQAFEGRRLQVMVHETWIGASTHAPLKDKLLGLWQRRSITALFKRLKPSVLHTSNPSYAGLLRQQGVDAKVLSLFGAVPVQDGNGDEWLLPLLRGQGTEINQTTRNKFWLFGIFGTLHPVWPPEPLLGGILEAARKAGKTPLLLSLGRIGSGEGLWNQIAANYASRLPCHLIGPLENARLSEAFNSLDFGIAATPWGIIGKSSAAAAMIEHGLPVIVNRDDSTFRGVPEVESAGSPLFNRLDEHFFDQLPKLGKGARASRLPQVTIDFLASFSSPCL